MSRLSRVAAVAAVVAVAWAAPGCGLGEAAPLATVSGPAVEVRAAAAPVQETLPQAEVKVVSPSPTTTAPPPPPPPDVPAFDPGRLRVPALDVDSPVVDVGVTEDLVLTVPDDPTVMGRWDDGAKPGDGTGTIVLVSHIAYRGRPGALENLPDLPVGSDATLTGPDGQERRYVVSRVDTYRKSALPYQDIFRFDVPERLVLITCGGEIDRSTGHYDSNVVAYLDPA